MLNLYVHLLTNFWVPFLFYFCYFPNLLSGKVIYKFFNTNKLNLCFSDKSKYTYFFLLSPKVKEVRTFSPLFLLSSNQYFLIDVYLQNLW